MSKVDIGVEVPGDILVAGELLAVVESKRMHQTLKWLQQSCRGVPDLDGCLSGEFLNQGEAGFALHQRDQRALVSSAGDGVALPVTQAASFIDDGRVNRPGFTGGSFVWVTL